MGNKPYTTVEVSQSVRGRTSPTAHVPTLSTLHLAIKYTDVYQTQLSFSVEVVTLADTDRR